MYITDFVCTYKRMETEREQDEMYRIQLLQAFNLNEWNDKAVDQCNVILFNELFEEKAFKGLLDIASTWAPIKNLVALFCLEYSTTEPPPPVAPLLNLKSKVELSRMEYLVIFKLLFNYDHFDIWHGLICEYKSTGQLTKKSVEAFKKVSI
jgi:hypothetical protein